MVDVVRQRPMSILYPYMIEAYVARDGSEACLSLNPPKVFCARDGTVKEVKLEFSRYEVYEEKTREVHRPKGLLAFTTAAREYTTLAVFSSLFCIKKPPRCGWRRLGSWGFLQSWLRRPARLRLASEKHYSSSSIPPDSRVSPLRPLSKPP